MTTMWPKGTVRHLVAHPLDVAPLVRSAWRLRRQQWWMRAPFLPIPDRAYWAFRVTTAYGESDAEIDINDAVAAARWSVRHRPGR